MRIGPCIVERRWVRGDPVRQGVLLVVPVARVVEVRLRVARCHGRWLRATPHHVIVRMLAGERRVSVRPLAPWLPLLAGLPILAALAVTRRPRSTQEARTHGNR